MEEERGLVFLLEDEEETGGQIRGPLIDSTLLVCGDVPFFGKQLTT